MKKGKKPQHNTTRSYVTYDICVYDIPILRIINYIPTCGNNRRKREESSETTVRSEFGRIVDEPLAAPGVSIGRDRRLFTRDAGIIWYNAWFTEND